MLVGLIGALSQTQIPECELEPLAELVSMGMAATVLWWMETPGVARAAVLDALVRVWSGVLTGVRLAP